MSPEGSVTYRVLHDYRLALFTYRGPITVETNAPVFLDYCASADFRPDYHVFVDQAASTFTDRPYERMQRLTVRLRPYFDARAPEARTVLYSPYDSQFAISRLYQSVSSTAAQRPLLVCRTKAEGLAFLDLDPTDPDVHEAFWPGEGMTEVE